MKWFKKITTSPDWREVIGQELKEAQMGLLKAETALDWAQAEYDYQYNRMERLKGRLEKDEV
jgi:hypothetical protein